MQIVPSIAEMSTSSFGIDGYTDTVMTDCLGEDQVNEPSTIKEAFTSDLAEEWKLTADVEYQSLI